MFYNKIKEVFLLKVEEARKSGGDLEAKVENGETILMRIFVDSFFEARSIYKNEAESE